jgi:hypothetical protein
MQVCNLLENCFALGDDTTFRGVTTSPPIDQVRHVDEVVPNKDKRNGFELSLSLSLSHL